MTCLLPQEQWATLFVVVSCVKMVGCCVFVMVKRALCLLRRLENRVRGRVEKEEVLVGRLACPKRLLQLSSQKQQKN